MEPDEFAGRPGLSDHARAEERAYSTAALGVPSDRLEPLHDERAVIEGRLFQITPKTLDGVVRLLSVWLASMCDDVRRDASGPDDRGALVAEAASRAQALVEQMVRGDARRLA